MAEGQKIKLFSCVMSTFYIREFGGGVGGGLLIERGHVFDLALRFPEKFCKAQRDQ